MVCYVFQSGKQLQKETKTSLGGYKDENTRMGTFCNSRDLKSRYICSTPLRGPEFRKYCKQSKMIEKVYDMVHLKIISVETEGSITKIHFKKLWLLCGNFEWSNTRGLMGKYGPTTLYIIFKSINTATRIGVYNKKYEIEKATIYKFGRMSRINEVVCLRTTPSLLTKVDHMRPMFKTYSERSCWGKIYFQPVHQVHERKMGNRHID